MNHRNIAIRYKRSMDLIAIITYMGVINFQRGIKLYESAYAKLRYHMAQDRL